LSLAALLPPPPPDSDSGVFPVQPARRTPAPMNATAVDVTRRYPRCLVADNVLSSLSPHWRRRQVVVLHVRW
jgi:hypothetical protein